MHTPQSVRVKKHTINSLYTICKQDELRLTYDHMNITSQLTKKYRPKRKKESFDGRDVVDHIKCFQDPHYFKNV